MDINSSLRSSIYSAFLLLMIDKPNITHYQSNDVGFDKKK